MVSAKRGAILIKIYLFYHISYFVKYLLPTERRVILSIASSPGFLGVVLVTTIFSRTEFLILLKALPEKRP